MCGSAASTDLGGGLLARAVHTANGAMGRLPGHRHRKVRKQTSLAPTVTAPLLDSTRRQTSPPQPSSTSLPAYPGQAIVSKDSPSSEFPIPGAAPLYPLRLRRKTAILMRRA